MRLKAHALELKIGGAELKSSWALQFILQKKQMFNMRFKGIDTFGVHILFSSI
ncbi:MAG: hypothetical protein RR827_09215 [Oscillospiraceae bacterium]